MTPAESRRVAALELQLADLARQLGNARGLGVNTANGATHYRTTQLGFPAELTAGWDADNGYAWKRLRLTGLVTGNPGVQPTGIGAVTPDGDETLGAGDRGWMEPSPDAQGFYFIAGGSEGTDTDCGSCSWLADVVVDSGEFPPPRMLLQLRGGSGRCGCIDSEGSPADPDAGAEMVYDPDDLNWKGGTEVALCCGCAYPVFTITNPDALTATLTLNQFVSCQEGTGTDCDGGPTPTLATITLVQECCGADSEGRPYVSFWGKGPDPCSGDPAACDNTFHVRVICKGSDCDLENNECGSCIEGDGPAAYVVDASGFTGCCLPYTGRWRAEPTTACTWVATCADTGITVTVVVTCLKVTVTFAGAAGCGTIEYEQDEGGTAFVCFENKAALTPVGEAPAATVNLEFDTCVVPCQEGLKVSSSGGLPCSVCDGSPPVVWTDLVMTAVEGFYTASLGDGGITPDCECDEVGGSGTCRGFGVVVRCNGDGTFTVGPYCMSAVGCETEVVCYAGIAAAVTVANAAVLPSILFSVTFTVDNADCPESPAEVTLTFTNL